MIRAHITRQPTTGWTYRLTDTNTRWTLTAGTCDTHSDALSCACRHIRLIHDIANLPYPLGWLA